MTIKRIMAILSHPQEAVLVYCGDAIKQRRRIDIGSHEDWDFGCSAQVEPRSEPKRTKMYAEGAPEAKPSDTPKAKAVT